MTNWPKTIRIDQSMAHYCTNSIRGEREYTDSDLAEKLAQALGVIISFDDDEGIFDCLEYVDMFKSADFRKTMEQARQALADYRGE